MKFARFYHKANVGDRVQVTDTFLVARPTWTGTVLKIRVGGVAIIHWDDREEDTTFTPSNTRDTDIFEILPNENGEMKPFTKSRF